MAGEGYSGHAPKFDGFDFILWKRRMQSYLGSLGYDVWVSVLNGYTEPEGGPVDSEAKKAYCYNQKAVNAIFSALDKSMMAKVMDCDSAKDIWGRLKSIYERDEKIRKAKLQTFRGQFESLLMQEGENIDTYMTRVNEVVNSIRGLGANLEDSVVCQKILRSLLPKYDSKVSAIEEAKDLDTITLDQVHGTFTALEMRWKKGKSTDKQAAFKAMKNLKINEKKKKQSVEDTDESEDEVTAHFTRKLKRGTGKYKDKLPFKCFNCGRVGHFAAKCPNQGKIESDEDESEKKIHFKGKKKFFSNRYKKGKDKKKSLVSKKCSDTSDEESEESSNDEDDEAMFIVSIDMEENKEDSSNKEDFTEEEEEDEKSHLEAELIIALRELKRDKKKVKNVTQDLKGQEQIVLELRDQANKSRKTLDDLEYQLSQKTIDCNTLELEKVALKAQLEEQYEILAQFDGYADELALLKAKVEDYGRTEIERENLENEDVEDDSTPKEHPSSKKLNDIINAQKSTHIKFGLGFVGESSKNTKANGKGTIHNPIKVNDRNAQRGKAHVTTAGNVKRAV